MISLEELPRFAFGTHRSPCWTFWTRAVQTWDDLLDADFDIGEETLTDNNLLAVRRAHFPLIQHYKFTRFEEHELTGADWEWWFTAGERSDWLGLRFQAKRISSTGRYRQLNTKHGRSQADLLVSRAERDRVFPMYVFYNAWRRTGGEHWNCTTFPRIVKLLGCAVAPAVVVQPLLQPGRRNLARTVLGLCVPWSCLVCCDSHGSGRLPDRVQAYLTDLWPPVDGSDAIPTLRPPPSYVAEALRYSQIGDADGDGVTVVENETAAPVSDVLVTTDPPLRLVVELPTTR